MRTQNRIVEYLINLTKDDPSFSGVRFSTKKVNPTFKPYPEVQVVILETENNASTKAWQGRTTILKQQLLIMHTYSKNNIKASEVAEMVCELLDGSMVEGLRSVSINAWPTEIEYDDNETLFYSNIEIW